MFKPTVNKKVTNKPFNFNFQFYTLNAYRRQQLALFLFLLKKWSKKSREKYSSNWIFSDLVVNILHQTCRQQTFEQRLVTRKNHVGKQNIFSFFSLFLIILKILVYTVYSIGYTSLSGIPVFHNQATIIWVSMTKTFFW